MTQPNIRLFVSDMDSTMIANECIDEMARMLDEKKPVVGAPNHYFEQVQAITKATMDGAALPFNESLKKRIGILAEAGFQEAWLPEIYTHIKPMEGADDIPRCSIFANVRFYFYSIQAIVTSPYQDHSE